MWNARMQPTYFINRQDRLNTQLLSIQKRIVERIEIANFTEAIVRSLLETVTDGRGFENF